MSGDLMESEREIMEKNKKLYELEMRILKETKNHSIVTTSGSSYGDAASGYQRMRMKLD